MKTRYWTVALFAAAFAVTACSGESSTAPLGPDVGSRSESPADPTAAATGRLGAQGWTEDGCRSGDPLVPVMPGGPDDPNGDGYACASGSGYYDNKLPGGKGGGGGGWTEDGCRSGDPLVPVMPGGPDDPNADGYACASGSGYYDNRI